MMLFWECGTIGLDIAVFLSFLIQAPKIPKVIHSISTRVKPLTAA